jgi:hypothetical protein
LAEKKGEERKGKKIGSTVKLWSSKVQSVEDEKKERNNSKMPEDGREVKKVVGSCVYNSAFKLVERIENNHE